MMKKSMELILSFTLFIKYMILIPTMAVEHE